MVLALTISAIVQPARAVDRCAPPRPNAPVTLATLARNHGDARPMVMTAVNLALAEDDCLRRAAYRGRGAHGPIEAAADAAIAQCGSAFRAYEAAQAKTAPSPAAHAAIRKDEKLRRAQTALGYARAYRACAREPARRFIPGYIAKP
jgi:hypothetical protein